MPSRSILLFLTDLETGGTPTVVRELSARLHDPPRVSVGVACLAPRGPVAEAIECSGVQVTALNAHGSADLRVFPRLLKLIHGMGHDTVLSFLVHANAVAAAVSPLCPGVRFLQSIQTTQPLPRWHWAVQSLAHHAAERIIVPSPSVAQVAQQWAGVPPEKIVVIPNAIDPVRFPRDTGSRVTTGPVPIGFIGRLDPVKRVPDLIEAVRLLKGRVHLHVFGDGPERQRIEIQVKQLGVSSMVSLHGTIALPVEALRAIAVLVLPSAAEGFGLVLIEAMAAGVPVVATNVAGIRDVVRHGVTGLLVPAGSPRDLAGAIARLLDHDDLRRSLVNEASREVRNRFSWDVVLPQYRALLALDSPARATP